MVLANSAWSFEMGHDYNTLRHSLILKGLTDSQSLPVLARSGDDPGSEYFVVLKKELRLLFDLIGSTQMLDRELCAALFGLGHTAFLHFEAARQNGRMFRDSLFDQDLLQIEAAVSSIFEGVWIEVISES